MSNMTEKNGIKKGEYLDVRKNALKILKIFKVIGSE